MKFKFELRREQSPGRSPLIDFKTMFPVYFRNKGDIIIGYDHLKKYFILDTTGKEFQLEFFDPNDSYLNLGALFKKKFTGKMPTIYLDVFPSGFANKLAQAIQSGFPKVDSFHFKTSTVVWAEGDEFFSMINTLGNSINSLIVTVDNDLSGLENEICQFMDSISKTLPIMQVESSKFNPVFLKCLPERVNSVEIYAHSNFQVSGEELKAIFNSLHDKLEHFSLNNIDFKSFETPLLSHVFGCLPKNLKSLALNNASLKPDTLMWVLQAISVKIHTLNLADNPFHKYSAEELQSIFTNLPESLNELSLAESFCAFNEALIEAMPLLPSSVIKLDLSDNMHEHCNLVRELKKDFLSHLIIKIPKTVQWLDLGDYWLDSFPTGYFEEIFGLLGSHFENLTWLGLAKNQLGQKSGAALARAFALLPRSLQSLNLADNNFGDKTSAELLQLLSGIKEHVKSIDLTHNQLFKDKSSEQRDKLLTKLRKVNSDGCRLNLSHNGESVIARAMPPLLDAIRQNRLTPYIVNNHILNHLSPVKNLIRGDVAGNLFFSNGAGAARPASDDIEMVIETTIESEQERSGTTANKRPADSSLEEGHPAKIARH